MYLFYENIKKEVDLQDLVLYLNEPLNKLKVLQLKLKEYKTQHPNDNKIEIEELIRETDKVEKSLFPDLINNYCKLSLEFRNKINIKEGKDNNGNIIKYTSKDLLLKNSAKLIEHIQILEEKYYTYFSFDFLVNSRIIADLGFQENYLDEKHEAIVLENQYKFSAQDAKEITEKELVKNNTKPLSIEKEKEIEKPKPVVIKKEEDTTEKRQFHEVEIYRNGSIMKIAGAALPMIQPVLEKENNEEIFEKKPVESTEIKQEVTSGGGITLIELLLTTSMIALMLIMTMTVYNRAIQKSKEQEAQYEQMRKDAMQAEQQQTVAMPFEKQQDTNQLLAELAANREKNSFNYVSDGPYKETLLLTDKIKNWRDMTIKSNVKNQEINYTNLITSGYNLKEGQILASPKDMIYDSRAYHIDLIKNKVEIKISNVGKEECKYMAIKLMSQMDLKSNDKEIKEDNIKTSCEVNNTLTLTEK